MHISSYDILFVFLFQLLCYFSALHSINRVTSPVNKCDFVSSQPKNLSVPHRIKFRHIDFVQTIFLVTIKTTYDFSIVFPCFPHFTYISQHTPKDVALDKQHPEYLFFLQAFYYIPLWYISHMVELEISMLKRFVNILRLI